jgi:hypothetical protein
MNRQEKIGSLIGDIGIPILGFFFWNWSIYFICLFFLLDQLSREVSHWYRMRYIKKQVPLSSKSYLLNLLIFIAFFFTAHWYNFMLHPTINFAHEMSAFFWYKDSGIAQGFILFPLVMVSERMRFKMNMKQFSSEMHLKSWQNHSVQLLSYFLLFLILSIGLTAIEMSKTASFLCLILGFASITLFADKLSAFFPR